MKKLTVLATALTLSIFSVASFAEGFSDPNQSQVITKISELDKLNDDQLVVLQGKIVKRIGKEDFIIRDRSGEKRVEIEDEAWRGIDLTPNDEVRFYGEVEKSWNKTEVEIHRMEKIQ
ncbi:NirD/YgiW/YdeI family stress tolerance protein [Otariodibacter sp.]|uniref:YgiW/YdeI family stress tolerance OB fold protein n=1 Tax=Otariodibacter sp. TaxID=3030919 RepID=UPI0026198C05|nr:NirD/YgiW/YdeI family stress tolerance protein [Otariodibacter sp.]